MNMNSCICVCSCLTGSCVCVSSDTLVWWRPFESAVLDIPSATPSWSLWTATGCSCLESNQHTNRFCLFFYYFWGLTGFWCPFNMSNVVNYFTCRISIYLCLYSFIERYRTRIALCVLCLVTCLFPSHQLFFLDPLHVMVSSTLSILPLLPPSIMSVLHFYLFVYNRWPLSGLTFGRIMLCHGPACSTMALVSLGLFNGLI